MCAATPPFLHHSFRSFWIGGDRFSRRNTVGWMEKAHSMAPHDFFFTLLSTRSTTVFRRSNLPLVLSLPRLCTYLCKAHIPIRCIHHARFRSIWFLLAATVVILPPVSLHLLSALLLTPITTGVAAMTPPPPSFLSLFYESCSSSYSNEAFIFLDNPLLFFFNVVPLALTPSELLPDSGGILLPPFWRSGICCRRSDRSYSSQRSVSPRGLVFFSLLLIVDAGLSHPFLPLFLFRRCVIGRPNPVIVFLLVPRDVCAPNYHPPRITPQPFRLCLRLYSEHIHVLCYTAPLRKDSIDSTYLL